MTTIRVTHETHDGWPHPDDQIIHQGASESFITYSNRPREDNSWAPKPFAPNVIPPPPPRPPPPIDSAADTECYPNYWLCMFDTGEDVELFNDVPHINGQPCTRDQFAQELTTALKSYRIVTFNGLHYDMPLVTLALGGASNARLKEASDAIIVYGVKSWDIAEVPKWINHVDLIEVAPGQGSLKMYGGKMHSRTLQDLPFDPASVVTEEMRQTLRQYCKNDLRTTRDLLETFPTQLELRDEMSREYSVDLRSKSDAQIAEAVMKSLLPFKPQRPVVLPGSKFYYRPPEWLSFQRLDVLELLARAPFAIAENGSPVMTDELANTVVRIGGSAYQMGIGGLHSTESKTTHRADDAHVLTDHDVASYYPSLILRTEIYPKQIGLGFLSIYRGWFDQRMEAKRAGKKKKANSFKTLLNGTFGKLGSPWSIFYAPSEMIQVTITGQLALLMLIEMLELSGISVVSANTDGIVVKCPRHLEWMRAEVITWWQSVTGFETERNDYRLLASRDVNSYVAITTAGEVKVKGAYAPPEPGASGWPNPTGQISVDAVVAYLRDGVPLLQTVMACRDIRQFVHLRGVKGGGSYAPNGVLPAAKATTQKAMREVLGWPEKGGDKLQLIAEYTAHVATLGADRQYLGKAVRWYMARNSRGCIVTPAGHLVARTEGCRPLMELPDEMPEDVDYMWYVNEAASLLADLSDER